MIANGDAVILVVIRLNQMGYLLVALLSIVFAFLGFATEIARGNISHIENGREPNAGASIFPVIPLGPMFLVGLVWLLNNTYHNLGFWAFVAFTAWHIPSWWISQTRLNNRLKELTTGGN